MIALKPTVGDMRALKAERLSMSADTVKSPSMRACCVSAPAKVNDTVKSFASAGG